MSQILEQYIEAGVGYIVEGDPLRAHRHFTHDSLEVDGLDVHYSVGSLSMGLGRLKTEGSLVRASRALASQCWISENGHLLIAGWMGRGEDGQVTSALEDNPDLYFPEFVSRFYHETGVLAAEEWLHLLQRVSGGPLAGVEDIEADVAAHLDTKGVLLTADFLTRYLARYEWCLETYPNRQEELDGFIEAYGAPPF